MGDKDISEINLRNKDSVFQKLADQDRMIREQAKQISDLLNSISDLTRRMMEAETFIIIQKVKSMGTGPTVK